jgi:hypothetical protein
LWLWKTNWKPLGLQKERKKKGLFHITEQNPTSTFYGHKQNNPWILILQMLEEQQWWREKKLTMTQENQSKNVCKSISSGAQYVTLQTCFSHLKF